MSAELHRYQVVVIHSSYRLANLFGFIENSMINGSTSIIYLSLNPFSGQMNQLSKYINFVQLDENKMDVELPLALHLLLKQKQKMEILDAENTKWKNRAKDAKIFNECKIRLIETGLSENEAHQLILKRSMDEKQNKYVTAAKIMKELSSTGCEEKK